MIIVSDTTPLHYLIPIDEIVQDFLKRDDERKMP
jgi:hypothetical protein